MFVKFDCGCIRFQIEEVSFAIKNCDEEFIGIYREQHEDHREGKVPEPLNLKEVENLFSQISTFVDMGIDYLSR